MNVTSGKPANQVVYRSPLTLPRISYTDIVDNAAEGVYVEHPGTQRLIPRAPPVFHDDPDNAGLFKPFKELVVTYPPVFTTSLRDVMLVGFRSVLSPAGFFVNDIGFLKPEDADDFLRTLGRHEEIAHLMPVSDKGVFSHCMNGQQEVHLDGPVVLLTSAEAGNFGSFIYRDLVKLVNLTNVPANWRFLIHLGDKTFEQFLELAGLPMERLIQHNPRIVYHIDQAIIPGLRNPFAMADLQTRAFYDGLRAHCDTGQRGRRLYISRHSVSAVRPTGRVMANELTLIERLRPLGFDILETQYLTATEQIAAFASADLVVGPSGSGMFNAVFCRPGTKLIDIESEPHWIYPHSCLFASACLQYGIFEGLAVDRNWSVHHKQWHVNIDMLVKRICEFSPQSELRSFFCKVAHTDNQLMQPLWSIPEHTGENYRTVLQRFHTIFNPSTYLEIGVADGATIELATCSTIAIDPEFRIVKPIIDNKPSCCLYKMSSDTFFKLYNPSAIFGQHVEMAFLDGMHWFEFLLRDFMNVETHCKPNTIIFMHDCIPTDNHVSRRDPDNNQMKVLSPHPDWWAGDVWKVVAILLKYRPDLKILSFNAEPTGLIAVTNLDPSSNILKEKYFQVIEEYGGKTMSETGESYLKSLGIVDTRDYNSLAALSSLFWI